MRSAADLEAPLRRRILELTEEGQRIWDRFDMDVRQQDFHPFVPADYDVVLAALLRHCEPGRRFLEWGSATGVITIMADMLGFEAYGIEIDGDLVRTARDLARHFDSGARFAAGSFLPAGYQWRSACGDTRLGTIEPGPSGYLALGRHLEDFDVVYGYPWNGEEPVMQDVMRSYGRRDARLLINTGNEIRTWRAGRLEP
jgi:hypothetical protein